MTPNRSANPLSPLLSTVWDRLTPSDLRGTHEVGYLCPVCSAWVWSIEKHRAWHLALPATEEPRP